MPFFAHWISLSPTLTRKSPPKPDEHGGPFLWCEAPMLMVGVDEVAVESDLLGGPLVCPNCDGELRPWWFARARKLRDGDGDLRIRPRRAICQECRTTHVLLPVVGLLRRRDLAR